LHTVLVTEIGEWQSQVRRGLLELCILALLDRQPSYGYEIVTRLGAAPRLAAGEGTVYPLLRRLRQLGWLETYWQESTAGPPRQYYRLSPEGRSYLTVLRGEWRDLASSVGSFLDHGEPVDEP
jgi:PadR family transcriptional regulator PadR